MTEIFVPGNKLLLFTGSMFLIALFLAGFGIYREMKTTKIRLANKELVAYENQLNKSNEMEIEGLTIK